MASGISDRDNLIMAWKQAETELAAIKSKELALRNEIVALCFEPGREGTQNLDLGMGYKLKAVIKNNYNLANREGQTDAAIAAMEKSGQEGKFIAERLVRWKPDLSISEWRNLPEKFRKLFQNALTISPATPSLELVPPPEKK